MANLGTSSLPIIWVQSVVTAGLWFGEIRRPRRDPFPLAVIRIFWLLSNSRQMQRHRV